MQRRDVVLTVTLIETVTLTLAFALGHWFGAPWWRQLQFVTIAPFGVALGVISSAMSLGILIWVRRHGFPRAASYVDTYFVPAARALHLMDIAFIAAASGLAEEALFRGVLQPKMGLIACSLLFGLLHTSTRDTLSSGVWATVMSLFLGFLYTLSGTLWCPILCHATHNFATLVYLRGPFAKTKVAISTEET